MKDGLSSNAVNVIYKDSKGLVWIGTKQGLNKYSACKITSFKTSRNDKFSISGDNITAIAEDKQGKLWIGTTTGLNRFNRDTETFTHFVTNQKKEVGNDIKTLFVDYDGYMWIGFEGRILKFNPNTKKSVPISKDNYANKYLKDKTVRCIFEDSNRNIWLATWANGLVKLNANRTQSTLYINNPSDSESLPYNTVSSIYEDKNKQLWMGAYNATLSILNPATNKFTRGALNPFKDRGEISDIIPIDDQTLWICQGKAMGIVSKLELNNVQFLTTNTNDSQGFTADYARNMYKDNSGIVWIGTTNAGVSIHDPNRDKFSSYFHQIGNENVSEKRYAKSIFVDKQNNLWIGTYQKGLYYYNVSTNEFSHFWGAELAISEETINDICQLKSGLLWISTLDGILIFNPSTKKKIGYLKLIENEDKSQNQLRIVDIFQDSRDGIWVTTEKNLKFLHNNSVIHFNNKEFTDGRIKQIAEDKNGNIWIATENGIVEYQWKIKKIIHHLVGTRERLGFNNSITHCVYVDAAKTLWIGTRNGLKFFDYEAKVFRPYEFKNPLSDQNIYRIIEDSNRNLWFTTGIGLSKLNKKTRDVQSFDEGDGLIINPENIQFDNSGNIILSAKYSGFYRFNPANIKQNKQIPGIIINGLSIMNKPVIIDPNNEDAVLSKHISATKSITINYDQSVLEFELNVLSFTLPEKNQLAYQLVGFDKDWIYTTAAKRFITYTNLSTGKYTLKVKGSNNDGVWNETGTTLDLIIRPPFWQTPFAYFIYLALFGVLLFSYRRYSIIRFQEKSKQEISQLKLHFFTNISHEFRTPLTLISGPLMKLMTELKVGKISNERLLEQLALIQRNSNRLMSLINQLLDFQKTETGNLKLETSYGDLIPFMQSIFDAFFPLAQQKNIKFSFLKSENSLLGDFDFDKLEKIVTNLLSNAFKFTKNEVNLKISKDGETLLIEVHDNGIGITKDNLTKIFDNFYQVDHSNTRKNEGSGIGLALTRELVKLHKGTINAESKVDEKTVIKVTLPFATSTPTNAQPMNEELKLSTADYPLTTAEVSLPTSHYDELNILPQVLIVEDNEDLRFYICDILSKNYTVVEAQNGRIGVEKALEMMPEMIISDVMMPEMDGMELCKQLKTDSRTSHIPIILLSAFSANETKLQGTKNGADDYLTKPFHAELLLAKIENLIKLRRQLQLKFQQSIYINTRDITSNETDDKLLKKAVALVEDNLEDPNFDNQQFVKDMGLSRTGLYVKMKALTGQSVSEFITSIRLRRAAQLLLTKQFNISEVYYKVGFQNRSHFNESFKNQFSMTPSEFIQTNCTK